jgi:hypothetical protein
MSTLTLAPEESYAKFFIAVGRGRATADLSATTSFYQIAGFGVTFINIS